MTLNTKVPHLPHASVMQTHVKAKRPPLYSTKEALELLGISSATFTRYSKDGLIPQPKIYVGECNKAYFSQSEIRKCKPIVEAKLAEGIESRQRGLKKRKTDE